MLKCKPALYTLDPTDKKLEIRDIALFSGRGIKNSFHPSLHPSFQTKKILLTRLTCVIHPWRWIWGGEGKKKNFILPFWSAFQTRDFLVSFRANDSLQRLGRDSSRNAIRIFFNPLDQARRVNWAGTTRENPAALLDRKALINETSPFIHLVVVGVNGKIKHSRKEVDTFHVAAFKLFQLFFSADQSRRE